MSFNVLGRQVEFDPKVINPPQIDESLFPRVSSLALDVSGICNLRCAYCAERLTMPERNPMKKKILNESLSSFFKWVSRKDELSIHVGSGESLLFPSSVRKIGLKARLKSKTLGIPLSLYITTNGTLLDDNICKWLIDDEWNIKISLDGNQEIQDRYRSTKSGESTFNIIERFVRKMANEIPDRFSTTSVLCSGTDPAEVFYSIASLGVRRIELLPVAAKKTSKFILRKKDLVAYRDFIFNYANQIVKGVSVPRHIRFFNRLLNAMGYRNARIPCGAGRTFFAIDPEGNVFPCFRFIGIQKYRLGDLNGIDRERVNWFKSTSGRAYEFRTECAKCWAAPLCGGPCYACADLFGEGSPHISYCEIVRSESKAALWLADYLREKNVEKLVQLLMTNC